MSYDSAMPQGHPPAAPIVARRAFWRHTALACLLLAATPGPLPAAETSGTAAFRAADFLNSIGVDSAIDRRGESLERTVQCARYLGVRWFRSGIEDCDRLQKFIDLHRQTGARFSWSLGSGGSDIPRLLATARELAAADALLAFEGPNEPNNWGVTYHGEKGGGRAPSWLAVAKLQSDLFQAVKRDAVLRQYPVWSISEGGAESGNVGLQFLTIPTGAGALMPDGTQYADYANVHNYIYHPNAPGLEDNKTWNAAQPTSACKVDGLYGNYGVTWARHYRGYSEAELLKLPRVTTETGCLIDNRVTEDVHALNLLSMFLDQFKRGWSHTAVYLLRDRTDEAGNQRFGFYKPDYAPRTAALYLHNLTTILADNDPIHEPGSLDYSIVEEPPTMHDMLLRNGEGAFQLIIWDERVKGEDTVAVRLGRARASVKIYDPTIGTSPLRSLTNSRSVELTLSHHPLVLEIN